MNDNNPQLRSNAQKLRKNMTNEEKKLWYYFFKKLPITVNRQKVIGNYIADFYCAKRKLIVELDGSQHYEEDHAKKDKIRDEYFHNKGIKVLRYSNYEINNNFEAVCNDILKYINDTSSVG